MTQLTDTELFMMLGAVIFAVIFFVFVTFAILLFFKRLQRQDAEDTQEDK